MSKPILRPLLASACLLALPSPALAETDDATPIAGGENIGMDLRSQASDSMIMPAGWYTVTGRMAFLTAPGSPLGGTEGGQVRFTDVALLGLEARTSFAGRAEFAASIDILPKQPSYTEESVLQRLGFSGRIGFRRRFAAYADLSAGPLLGGEGNWGAGNAGVQVRKSIHETTVFQLAAGGAITGLSPEGMTTRNSDWFAEAVAGGEIVFRVPNGMAAGWLGTQLRFPVADGRRGSAPDLDPHTRANVDLGVVLSYIDNWDIFALLSVIDRGDLVDPRTTLPILDGGFDQTQLAVGITRRFPREKSPPSDALMILP